MQMLPMSVVLSMLAVVTAPTPTLQIAFSQLKIPMGIPGFVPRMFFVSVLWNLCACSCEG